MYHAALLSEPHPTDDRRALALANEILMTLLASNDSPFVCVAALEIATSLLPFRLAAARLRNAASQDGPQQPKP
jgi:hypothetical protein